MIDQASEIARLLHRRFVARPDSCFCVEGHAGWQIPRDPLGECLPLTPERIRDHVVGQDGDDGGPVRVFLFDTPDAEDIRFCLLSLRLCDENAGWEKLRGVGKRIARVLKRQHMFPFSVQSDGGRAMQIYLFFEEPASAKGVRRFLSITLDALGFSTKRSGDRFGSIVIYPARDDNHDGHDDVVRLPFHAASGDRVLDGYFHPRPAAETDAWLRRTRLSRVPHHMKSASSTDA